MEEVAFYIPRERVPPPEAARAWEKGERLQLESEGPTATEQAWVYQTYVRLHANGFPCRLVHEVPERGVLVAFVSSFDTVPASLQGDVFFICVVADAIFHPFANWYVVQNPRQTRRARNSTFLPHWPQPFLQPRDPERGDAFENVHYYGHPSNLAPALRSPRWRERLRAETGLRFRVCGSESWHDYREVDAVVAVRNFEENKPCPHKPATKLYNAWLAGVPAVCGKESAFQAERRSLHDYLEAQSPREVVQRLRLLKNHPSLVSKMRANAACRAREHTAEAVRRKWQQFLASVVPPQYERWQRTGALQRRAFYLWQRAKIKGQQYRSRFF